MDDEVLAPSRTEGPSVIPLATDAQPSSEGQAAVTGGAADINTVRRGHGTAEEAEGVPGGAGTAMFFRPRGRRRPLDDDDSSIGAYHIAGKNYQQETDEMMRTGLIDMWPYLLRKPPDKKRRLWNEGNVAVDDPQQQRQQQQGKGGQEVVRPLTAGPGLVFMPRQEPDVKAIVQAHEARLQELQGQIETVEGRLKELNDKNEDLDARGASVAATAGIASPGDTPEEDMVDCPMRCGAVVKRRVLLQHRTRHCGMRMVRCPMPGCHKMVRASHVRTHLEDTCRVAAARRKLARRAKHKHAAVRSCPNGCGLSVKGDKALRRHLRDECTHRLIHCARPGCGMQIRACDVGTHEEAQCAYTRNRERKIHDADARHVPMECAECKALIPPSLLARHASHECLHRIVGCPWKCGRKVKAVDVPAHRARCPMVRQRDMMAEKNRSKRLMMECPACGVRSEVRRLAQHERESCNNRRVPCRNWECGCHEMIRLRLRALHEKVDHLLRPRPCLHFGGGSGVIRLGEVDGGIGWTAEFWVLKTDVLERTRRKCLIALEYKRGFDRARASKKAAQARLDILTALQEDMSRQALENKRNRARAQPPPADDAREAMTKLLDHIVEAAGVLEEAAYKSAEAQLRFEERVTAAGRAIQELRAMGRPLDDLVPRRRGSAVDVNDVNDYGGVVASASVLEEERPGLPSTLDAGNSSVSALTGPITVDFTTTLVDADNDHGPGHVAVPASVVEGTSATNSYTTTVVESHPTDITHGTEQEEGEVDVFSRYDDAEAMAADILRWAETAQAAMHERQRKALKSDHSSQRSSTSMSEKSRMTRKQKKKQANKGKRKEAHRSFTPEEHAQRALAGTNGWDVVASSEGAKLMLEIGHQDRVGFWVMGDGEYCFPYALPWDEWVHVCFVTPPPPRKRCELFINGRSVGAVDGVRVAMPKMYIGDPHRALDGYMQEVRYWGVQRTPDEISSSHRALLPPNSTAHGLIGWWTFEEGHGAHVYDVTESRYRIRMEGGVKWSTQEETQRAPPTPQFRETLVCQVELRRARLVQRARMHFQLVACPLKCGVEVMRKDVHFHTEHLCSKRRVACWRAGCDKTYPLTDKAKHEASDCAPLLHTHDVIRVHQHKHTHVECVLGCGERVARKDLDDHMRKRCGLRRVQCGMCQESIPANRLKRHMKRYCEQLAVARRRAWIARQKLEERRRHYVRPWTAHMMIKGEEGEEEDGDDDDDDDVGEGDDDDDDHDRGEEGGGGHGRRGQWWRWWE